MPPSNSNMFSSPEELRPESAAFNRVISVSSGADTEAERVEPERTITMPDSCRQSEEPVPDVSAFETIEGIEAKLLEERGPKVDISTIMLEKKAERRAKELASFDNPELYLSKEEKLRRHPQPIQLATPIIPQTAGLTQILTSNSNWDTMLNDGKLNLMSRNGFDWLIALGEEAEPIGWQDYEILRGANKLPNWNIGLIAPNARIAYMASDETWRLQADNKSGFVTTKKEGIIKSYAALNRIIRNLNKTYKRIKNKEQKKMETLVPSTTSPIVPILTSTQTMPGLTLTRPSLLTSTQTTPALTTTLTLPTPLLEPASSSTTTSTVTPAIVVASPVGRGIRATRILRNIPASRKK